MACTQKKKKLYIYICVCVCARASTFRLLEADPYLSIVSQKKKKKIYLLLM